MVKKLLFFLKKLVRNLGKGLIAIGRGILFVWSFVWSYLPIQILCLTHDENFCEIGKGIKDKENLRFSLVGIFLGSVFIYFLTFPIKSTIEGRRFQLFSFLTIDEAIEMNLNKAKEEKEETSAGYSLNVHKEVAQYELQRTQSSVGVTQNKINNILSIGLVIVPILIAYGYKFLLIDRSQMDCIHKWLLIGGISLCGYCILCIVFLLLKNLNREYVAREKIEYDEELDDNTFIKIIQGDIKAETRKSLILTTMLLQIRKSVLMLFISFIPLIFFHLL